MSVELIELVVHEEVGDPGGREVYSATAELPDGSRIISATLSAKRPFARSELVVVIGPADQELPRWIEAFVGDCVHVELPRATGADVTGGVHLLVAPRGGRNGRPVSQSRRGELCLQFFVATPTIVTAACEAFGAPEPRRPRRLGEWGYGDVSEQPRMPALGGPRSSGLTRR